MDFFNTLGKGINALGNAIQAKSDELNKEIDFAYRDGKRLSDQRLAERYKKANGFKKFGYALVLEERGYLERDDRGNFVRTSKTL